MPLIGELEFSCPSLEDDALARICTLVEGMPGIRESSWTYRDDKIVMQAVLSDRTALNALTRASMAFYQVLTGMPVTDTTLRILPG